MLSRLQNGNGWIMLQFHSLPHGPDRLSAPFTHLSVQCTPGAIDLFLWEVKTAKIWWRSLASSSSKLKNKWNPTTTPTHAFMTVMGTYLFYV